MEVSKVLKFSLVDPPNDQEDMLGFQYSHLILKSIKKPKKCDEPMKSPKF